MCIKLTINVHTMSTETCWNMISCCSGRDALLCSKPTIQQCVRYLSALMYSSVSHGPKLLCRGSSRATKWPLNTSDV